VPKLYRVPIFAFFALFLGFFAQAAEAKGFQVLYKFQGGDGSVPLGSLIRDTKGNLYGTTAAGGASDDGTIFKLAPDGTETVLHSFSFFSDGASPQAGVKRDSAGNLYGTTEQGTGRNCECGGMYRLSPKGELKVLFGYNDSTDGAHPLASLIRRSGDFYGTAVDGGSAGTCDSGCGVIFRLKPNGKYRVVYAFTGKKDGSHPTARLITDKAGNFYGTTIFGGAFDEGVIFQLSPRGRYRVLYSFTGGADGGEPVGRLVKDQAGNLYGTASSGGISNKNCSGCGTVFKLAGDGTYSVLHAFAGGKDGAFPRAGLLRTRSGKVFGATEAGGGSSNCTSGCGTVFKIDAQGRETILHRFSGDDGAGPVAALIGDGDDLYGTAQFGGVSGNGVVFTLKK
jgi:uncharacterized repeat protein (TIGR03803 family)